MKHPEPSSELRQSKLAKSFCKTFAPRFVPDSVLVYAKTAGHEKPSMNEATSAALGFVIDDHDKMPDIVLFDAAHDRLILADCASDKKLMDGARVAELARLFDKARPGLVYVTAFRNRQDLAGHPSFPAWETHAWFADAPEHMVHFNGCRFLGPYS